MKKKVLSLFLALVMLLGLLPVGVLAASDSLIVIGCDGPVDGEYIGDDAYDGKCFLYMVPAGTTEIKLTFDFEKYPLIPDITDFPGETSLFKQQIKEKTSISIGLTDSLLITEDYRGDDWLYPTTAAKVPETAYGMYCSIPGGAEAFTIIIAFEAASGNEPEQEPVDETIWVSYAKEPAKSGDIYRISNAAELAWFAKNPDVSAILTADIDLAGHYWVPIESLTGTLDGDGHVITNMNFEPSTKAVNVALVEMIAETGAVTGITFTGNLERTNGSVASVAVTNNGLISDCHNEMYISSHAVGMGGIAANNYGIVEKCSNIATIAGNKIAYRGGNGFARRIGGIVGYNAGTVRDCYNTGKITTFPTIGTMGQIVGYTANANSVIERCYALGKIVNSGTRNNGLYNDWSCWGYDSIRGGMGSYLLAGGPTSDAMLASMGTVNDSYYIDDLYIDGDELRAYSLDNSIFETQCNYIDNTELDNLFYSGYSFAGRKISADDGAKLDRSAKYYAFYDVTNQQYVALELSGTAGSTTATVDVTATPDKVVTGQSGFYTTKWEDAYNIYVVPANTTIICFVNTDLLADYTTDADLTDKRANELTLENQETVLAQVQNTWPDAYCAIAAGIARANIQSKEEVITEISVTFRLIGATLSESGEYDVGAGVIDSEYVTWLETKSYTLPAGSTVGDLFVLATEDAEIRTEGVESGYVSGIYAPAVLGDFYLAEFTNGDRSGWMYTVNGNHPNVGLNGYYLEDGDEVVWHYINDYCYECSDWFDDPTFPNLGDESTWDPWLKVPDEAPKSAPKELAITAQPESVVCAMGDTVTFTVKAEGDGLTYTWYYKNPGRTKFTAMSASEKNTYTITMTDARNGRQMYCVVRDEYGNMLKTEVATMALPTLTITQQPANVVCGLNSTATFTVAAEGEGELTYQWYYKNPTASKFTAMAIGDKSSYAITMEAKRNGRQMYCVVRDTYGNAVKSDVVTMTMPELVITQQPESVTCADGEKATFTVIAEGEGLTYTWYYKNPRSSKFTAMSASEKNTYTITMNSARDGRQMYCVVRDANGQKLTTDTVTMTTAR